MTALRKHDRQPSDGEPAPAPPAGSALADEALDALAFTLRTIGEHGSRPPGTALAASAQQHFAAWARHVLVCSAPPGREEAWVGDHREWALLREDVRRHLASESAEVTQALDGLREVIWAFVGGFARALVDDATAEAGARQAIEHLEAVVTTGSTEELKAAALETVSELIAALDSRRARQREQARRLGEHITRLRSQLDEASREAELDGLTRLSNRKVLDRELERAQELSTLVDEASCLIMVDVDGFKHVNDVHGHALGDQVLRTLADLVVRCFPRKTDVVARFGGDEFAVIVRSAGAEDGERLASRLLDLIREHPGIPTSQDAVRFTASIGVAVTLPFEQPQEWLGRADRALYEAKTGGRDRFATCHGPSAASADHAQAA